MKFRVGDWAGFLVWWVIVWVDGNDGGSCCGGKAFGCVGYEGIIDR